MDFNKPYGIVRGDPGVAYMQDYDFFDSKGVFLKEALNKPKRKAAPAPKASPRARKVKNAKGVTVEPKTAQERMILEVGNINSIPKSVLDARKENRAALAAEENTDG
jgi:hypothetical protein